jgi:hypothetical protein
MFDRWFKAFQDDGSGGVRLDTSVSSGDNGTPAKDLNTLLNRVITDDDKLRIVQSF